MSSIFLDATFSYCIDTESFLDRVPVFPGVPVLNRAGLVPLCHTEFFCYRDLAILRRNRADEKVSRPGSHTGIHHVWSVVVHLIVTDGGMCEVDIGLQYLESTRVSNCRLLAFSC